MTTLTRPQTEAQLEALVLLECGRLAQPSLYPSLLVWKNEVGLYLPLSEAMAAVDRVAREPGSLSAQAVKAALRRAIRSIGQKGSPDLFLSVEGRLAGIELKRPAWRSGDGVLHAGGTVELEQAEWHAVARERKVVPVAVIDAVEQVEPFLRWMLSEAPVAPPSPARARWAAGRSVSVGRGVEAESGAGRVAPRLGGGA